MPTGSTTRWMGGLMPRHPQSERFHQVLKEIGDLHDKKGADYGRANDPFSNVRGSEEWGVAPWVGAMVRANDKIRRLQKYAQDGELANEGAKDSFLDLAVYALIALVLWEEEEQKTDVWGQAEAAKAKAEWEKKYGPWKGAVPPDWPASGDKWVELSAEEEGAVFDAAEKFRDAYAPRPMDKQWSSGEPSGAQHLYTAADGMLSVCYGCDLEQKDHNFGCPQRDTSEDVRLCGDCGADITKNPRAHWSGCHDEYVPAG